MARVILSGGAGFIGSHLCRAFLARGDSVVCVDNLLTGSEDNVADLVDDTRFEFLRHDVTQKFDVDGDIDAVMHFASPASPADFARIPIEILDVGSAGTRNMLDVAHKHGARFMLASTSEVYGDPLVHPQPETYWGNVNSIGPRSVYDEAKRFAEAMTMAYHRLHGVDVRVLRIFNTHGPQMRPDDGRVVSNFIVQALTGKPLTVYGDGSQTRSFCFVQDEVRGILLLLDSDYTGPVNIGNPNEFTILELAHAVLEVTGSQSPIEYRPLPADDPTQRKPDISLAKQVLGWEPTIQLHEGLERTAAYFRTRLDAGVALMAVGAVVVNFNAGEHLVECARSLRDAGVDDIVVVDNASSDGSTQGLLVADPDVKLILAGANHGYGGGVNRGLPESGGDYVLVLNPDVAVDAGAVKALAAVLDADPGVGLVGPRIEEVDGSLYPSARAFPRLGDAIGHAFVGLATTDNPFSRRYLMTDWDHAAARDVDWISGACFLARGDALAAIGGFDEAYFMYLEDVDLCWRAGQAGWRVRYEPAAHVTHVQGLSTGQTPYRMLAAHHTSLLRYWWRTTSWPGRLLAPAVVAGLAVRLVIMALKRAMKGRGPH